MNTFKKNIFDDFDTVVRAKDASVGYSVIMQEVTRKI